MGNPGRVVPLIVDRPHPGPGPQSSLQAYRELIVSPDQPVDPMEETAVPWSVDHFSDRLKAYAHVPETAFKNPPIRRRRLLPAPLGYDRDVP